MGLVCVIISSPLEKAGKVIMKIVGLTGGIATGKSTVLELLIHRGYQVLDADVIVRELQAKGSPLLREVSQVFGSTILNADGSLNRAELSKMIFGDEKKRAILDQMVHPAVRAEFERKIKLAQSEVIFLDVPLLFEAKFDDLVDIILVIRASTEKQLERLMSRNNLSVMEARSRIDAQMPIDEKVKLADFVIDNDGDLCELEASVEHFLRAINK